MHRISVVFFGLGMVLLSSSCTRPIHEESVTALNLSTGETRTFSSSSEVPGGWVPCPDETCSETPPGVPCQNLSPAVCTMFPECRLKELSCMAEGCVGPAEPSGSGSSEPGGAEPEPASTCEPAPPVCEYACIPKYPLLCDEITSESECLARADCDWGEQLCPMMACDNLHGCPPCPKSCGPKQPPTCEELDEYTCGERADCVWQPGMCPACEPQGDPDACACRAFCQPRIDHGCPEIWIEPPADCDDPMPQYDQNGCLSGYVCGVTACPAIYIGPPTCLEGEKPVEVYDANGCLVSYKCAPVTDCSSLSNSYAQALAAAKACTPSTTPEAVQCGLSMADSLVCGCLTFVNAANAAAVQKLRDIKSKWQTQGCDSPTVVCSPCFGPPTGASCAPKASGGGTCTDIFAGATEPAPAGG